MTLPFNPLRAAELARQAMEDDSKMTPGQWRTQQWKGSRVAAVTSTYPEPGGSIVNEAYANDANGIARTRNALREMAEQLEAAVQEVERLRTELALSMLSPTGRAYEYRSEFERLKRADVDQGKRIAELIAECERLRAELSEYRDHMAKHFPARGSTLGDYTAFEERTQELVDAACDWHDAQLIESTIVRTEERHKSEDNLRYAVNRYRSMPGFSDAHVEATNASAELAKMRPVYEAAQAWREAEIAVDKLDDGPDGADEFSPAQINARRTIWRTTDALRAAIDSALSSTHQAGTK